ncbi:MarR family transcriptional regulator [Anaerotruncus colihominis]|uniref:MarR family transcriptional regulator n=1 Tax=Anaerotruncus colihominis TaxID=169435 RepID=A0A845RPI8_9FIRM|nr:MULTISPECIES: MarR family transcriptional regulator [Anaerotruncus]MCI8492574.1 winged helix DNA-binding protein [Anaerotruncus sp.]NBI79542.1 MarR family transcriptional regulator [Anaerotruncus colihominis]
MEDKTNELLRAFNRIDKELDDIYHEVALRMNISDSAFTIFYIIHELGDGCLQKDICREAFANKQTVHSSIQKLERKGYLYLKQGRGRDKHICLTQSGKGFIETHIVPVVQKEREAFMALLPQEQEELLRLAQKYIKSLKEKLKQDRI